MQNLMKQDIIKTCIILGIACLSLFASFFLPVGFVRYAASAILVITATAIFFLVKRRSILSFNRKRVLLLTFAAAATFLMIYYVSGLFFGYYQAVYQLSLKNFFRFITPIAVIIVSSEITRNVSLAVKGWPVTLLTYLLCVLADLATENGILYFSSVYGLMDFIGQTLFPSLTSNLLLNYLSRYYGILPGIVYRSVLYLYSYVIPVIPNTPGILPSFVLMLLPLIMLVFLKALFDKKRSVARQKRTAFHFIGDTVIAVLLISFVMLISCEFRFGIIVIGSGSMSDEINRGDAVVFESADHCTVNENDVIIFENDSGTRIVHRVIEIRNENGQIQYITKGDANEDADPGYVTSENIVGVVRFKVLYIGYPSLWLKDIFK